MSIVAKIKNRIYRYFNPCAKGGQHNWKTIRIKNGCEDMVCRKCGEISGRYHPSY